MCLILVSINISLPHFMFIISVYNSSFYLFKSLPSVKTTRNSTGHLIRVEGVSPLILDWLSLRYKFELY
jgi:hypothetical protein